MMKERQLSGRKQTERFQSSGPPGTKHTTGVQPAVASRFALLSASGKLHALLAAA
jgi:hypothetical protein